MDVYLGEEITSRSIKATVAAGLRDTVGKRVIVQGRMAVVTAIDPDPATLDRFRVTARYLVIDRQPPSPN